LHMCSDELHPDDSCLVLHFDHERVLVAAHVEDDAVFAADARTGELSLDVLRPAPVRSEGLFVLPRNSGSLPRPPVGDRRRRVRCVVTMITLNPWATAHQ
jgi:hypothetical protein